MSINQLIHENPTLWKQGVSNELGQTTNGIGNAKGNNVLVFIAKTEVPLHAKLTYGNMICDH